VLFDPSQNLGCYLSWGRPSALALYDGGSGGLGASASTFGAPLNDNFCTVSLVSIVTSATDPSAVTVTFNFTFALGYSGTHGEQPGLRYGEPIQPLGTGGRMDCGRRQ
jgi:hypothetical protein